MKKKRYFVIVAIVMFAITATGCAAIKDFIGETKGSLIGRSFEITTYDHFANKTLQVTGTKVTVGLLENNANFEVESTGFKSEVIEVTINGSELLQVGNTVIFAEGGLDMVTDFEAPESLDVQAGGGFVPFDRLVNDYSNLIGKSKTILISSQMGIPLGVYQGEDVYVTIPDNLPKMTRLNIDGKSLYIHRANYVILDSKLLGN